MPAPVRATAQFAGLCPSCATIMVKTMHTRDSADKRFNVLFVCTGNSARSILGEAILNHLAVGRERFRAFSAGSQPKPAPHPLALELLARNGVPLDGLRSKSWSEFAQPGAPQLDFVFTVCDQAAGEACPYWPGQPMTAHWGLPDPAAVEGSDEHRRRAFLDAFAVLRRRIELFTSLPLASIERMSLERRLAEIGRSA